MSLAGCGLRRFEGKMADIHHIQTKSHTRRALSRSSVAMWRDKRAQSYHVAMRELLLSCGALARDKVGTRTGAMEEVPIGLYHLKGSSELIILYQNAVAGHSAHQ